MTTQRPVLGLYGGSFDPVHSGHIGVAKDVIKALALDAFHFIPCAKPPHKSKLSGDSHHRVKMLALAIKGMPEAKIDQRELQSDKVSYTVNTLASIRDELGRDASLNFVIGWDSWQKLSTWHQWQTLFTLANLVIVRRPGFSGLDADMQTEADRRLVDVADLSAFASGKICYLDTEQRDIASSDIRRYLTASFEANAGGNECCDKGGDVGGKKIQSDSNTTMMLPEGVLEYILEQKLYLESE